MKIIPFLVFTFLASISCAAPTKPESEVQGIDNSSTMVCTEGDYTLTVSRRGSFFGRNRITLKKKVNVLKSQQILAEDYAQNWGPDGTSLAEKLAFKEMPCSTQGFNQVLESSNSIVVQVYSGNSTCNDKGERETHYVQLKKSNEILIFRNCKHSRGF